jgi:hypothetical protein
MGRLLDVFAVLLLAVACVILVGSVWLVSRHHDLPALFALVGGVLMMRSSVDLLRPGRTK